MTKETRHEHTVCRILFCDFRICCRRNWRTCKYTKVRNIRVNSDLRWPTYVHLWMKGKQTMITSEVKKKAFAAIDLWAQGAKMAIDGLHQLLRLVVETWLDKKQP